MVFKAALVAALIGLCYADWELYKNIHGKVYEPREDATRRAIFMRNLELINNHNLRHDLGLTTYRQGVNRFTDLTEEEFLGYKGLQFDAANRLRKGELFKPEEFNDELPKRVDWREKGYVTPVKDQGHCGSCWTFSTTGALEGQQYKKTGKLISLSEQNLVDCAWSTGNFGCGGGIMDRAFEYVKENGGIDTEESYPYTAKEGHCKFNDNAIGAKCTGYVDIPKSEEALQKALAVVGPISIAIDASQPTFRHYKSGVYDEPECSSTMLDHGVLAVGYGTLKGVDYWLVKNSWNMTWGDGGYIRMSRNKDNQCGIASSASYPKV